MENAAVNSVLDMREFPGRAIEPPFLNAPGNVFLLDLIKVFIPMAIIPFIALVSLLIIFPKTLYFEHKRRKRRSTIENRNELTEENFLNLFEKIIHGYVL